MIYSGTLNVITQGEFDGRRGGALKSITNQEETSYRNS
jgi:hypothetical protein